MASDYAANYRNRSSINRQRPNRIPFAAADDATAGTIASAFDAIMSGRRVSLMKYLLRQDFGTAHPRGTNRTVDAVLENDGGMFQSVRFRNLKDGTTGDQVAAVFVGNCDVEGTGTAVTAASVAVKTLKRGEGT